MLRFIFLILVFTFSFQLQAAREILLTGVTVDAAGASFIESDFSVIYGGVAGDPCTGDGNTTCNSCTDTALPLRACNQKSIYSTLKINITGKLTKDVSSAKASIFVEGFEVASQSRNITAVKDSAVAFQIAWSDICAQISELGSSCTGGSAADLYSKSITFGVDSDASGSVESEEKKTITAKINFLTASADPTVTMQEYCPDTTSGSLTGRVGICNIPLLPGDEKVFIDEGFIYNNADSFTGGSIDWDGIALFPIPVANDGSADTASYTNFFNGQADPIFVSFNPTTAEIPDSRVKGGLENYQRYCFTYATRNKAQNIYKFVNQTTAAAATACVTPSEVVGLLEDKHCFISTAAFGSDMAPEVQTFRKFRNEYLLTNKIGSAFVKFYYLVSPSIAEFISQSEILKSITRAVLYPVLGFVYLIFNYGLLVAVLVGLLLIGLLVQIQKKTKIKKAFLVVLILFAAPYLKAESRPDTIVIQHPDAADGLIKIKKDGSYIYDLKRPLKSESSRITFGQAQHPEISIDIEQTDSNGDSLGRKTFVFDDFYEGASQSIIGFDYEWFPFINKGKLGLQLGLSLMYAQGHGRLAADPSPPSEEKYTFLTVPMNVGAVYRLEWKDNQLFAPYVAGGGTYLGLMEKREDKKDPKFAGAPGFYGAGGVLFNLSALDDETTGFELESQYGISNLWLSLEFKVVEVNSGEFKFSNQYFNAGMAFDF